ncbi:hypothetical protein E3N88_13878 [Mikania micrantha]|uniref:VAN3-binding protein-like auxin canalisation domain-containing protein n=1 Tax=Mikania micrantha TaxID=192012 RepID=A0A5N6P123_9ASTR|nr:hypothetical protein E3N88_13878 [Mikania micrantha]
MEFLSRSRSWNISALQVSKALAPSHPAETDEISDEMEDIAANPFAFASSQLIMERILPNPTLPPFRSGFAHQPIFWTKEKGVI